MSELKMTNVHTFHYAALSTSVTKHVPGTPIIDDGRLNTVEPCTAPFAERMGILKPVRGPLPRKTLRQDL
jgi:hypothetical protein